jgi:hypothetical protein
VGALSSGSSVRKSFHRCPECGVLTHGTCPVDGFECDVSAGCLAVDWFNDRYGFVRFKVHVCSRYSCLARARDFV